jgi:hypothetical protein
MCARAFEVEQTLLVGNADEQRLDLAFNVGRSGQR